MVIRRYSFIPIICLLLVAFSHTLIAQVYPDREELDVVRLVDGTVLKDVILEEVPEGHLEIQLYGGSNYVLGYEQIESVEREANPDYGMAWIELGAGGGGETGEVDSNDETTGTGEMVMASGISTETDRSVRAAPAMSEQHRENHRMTGHIIGAHSGAAWAGISGSPKRDR